MKRVNQVASLVLLCIAVVFTGCKQSLVISEVDYSQPVEAVLEADDNGTVEDVQQGLKFNVLPLQYAETGDTTSVTVDEIRLIRGMEGYYYITASNFKHVYVMSPDKSSLKLEKQIAISEEGISEPAFNQRDPYVQLLNRSTGEVYVLTEEGVQESESDETNVGGS